MIETEYLESIGFVGFSSSPYNLYKDYTKKWTTLKITHWVVDNKFTIDGKKMMACDFKELFDMNNVVTIIGSYDKFKLFKRKRIIEKTLDNG